jgi:hypothetical protein
MTRLLLILGGVALAAASFLLGSHFVGDERSAAGGATPLTSAALEKRLNSIDTALREARRERNEAALRGDVPERGVSDAAARTAAQASPQPGAEPALHDPSREPLPSEPSEEQLALEVEAEELLTDAIRAGAWRDAGQFRTRLQKLTRDQQVALVERYSAALNDGKLELKPGEVPF